LCAAILDRRDTVPAPPFSTAVNSRVSFDDFGDIDRKELAVRRLAPGANHNGVRNADFVAQRATRNGVRIHPCTSDRQDPNDAQSVR
jgi:hypothetical protein